MAQFKDGIPSKLKVDFDHPHYSNVLIFIGGEMPHWIKNFVNAMENSSDGSSGRNMKFIHDRIKLSMIEKVRRRNDSGLNTLRIIPKLSDDHFKKNAHIRMRVHLSARILSKNVQRILEDHCESNPELTKEYKRLMEIIVKLDTVIDIWNHP